MRVPRIQLKLPVDDACVGPVRITLPILSLSLALTGLLVFSDDRPSSPPTSTPAATAPPTPSLPAPEVMFEELKLLDARLFDAVFKDCDHGRLRDIVADEFEFLHDRGGLVATNGTQFVEIIRNACERRAGGSEPRSRREVEQGSLTVHPLQRYGAVQMGVHRFYILKEGQPEELGDTAKFIHVWRRVGTGWKLTRVISYDHQAAR